MGIKERQGRDREAVRRAILDAAREMGAAIAGRGLQIVYGAGILGGTPGDPAGVSEWLPRLTDRRRKLRRLLQEASTEPGAPASADARDRAAAERWSGEGKSLVWVAVDG